MLEPVPNLEFSHYLDRPDLFAAYVCRVDVGSYAYAWKRDSINDSEDPFERMLAVLRFTFSKDLKFVVSVSPFPVLISRITLPASCTAEL